MNTAQRIQSHQKRRMWSDPMSAVNVLAANTEQPKENADRIMLTLRTVFEKLKAGTASIEEFERLSAAINVGLIRAELIDPLAEETMVKGVGALMRCADIHRRHGKFGFTGPDLELMNDAVTLYEGILRLSTPKQMLDALETAARRMLEQSRRAVA
jgi:hypothetical protein